MRRKALSPLAILLTLGSTAQGQDQVPGQAVQDTPEVVRADVDHPLMLDRTGIHWVAPFEAARAEAKRRGQLLLVNPIAFGTDASGNW